MKTKSTAVRPRGRPREFDRGKVLNIATRLFARHGYEATSISHLTEAMSITPPQLYAAFGDKRQLFYEAVGHYLETDGSFATAALAQPTARQAVETLLTLAASMWTTTGHPAGCLVVLGAMNCGPESGDVETALEARRKKAEAAICAKIKKGIRAGELDAKTDAAALAKFYAAVFQGMSVQARDGATATELMNIAQSAMQAWPTS